MNMKSIIASSAMILASTVIASANPFTDVPASHWAYEAINSMSEKGIITGFPDSTFKGEQNVTRYQLAMVTAKLVAEIEQNGSKFGKDDIKTVEKLTSEFAEELSLFGVKITALENDMQVVKDDVAGLKKDMDGIKSYLGKGGIQKVKLSGDMLVSNHAAKIKHGEHFHRTATQLRLQMTANIDENVKAVARWYMVDDGNMDNGAPGTVGAAWNGTNHRTGGLDVAYLQIQDMFRFGGDFTFGRRFMTHGHGLVVNHKADVVNYIKRCGDIDLTLNCFFKRQGNEDYHNMWNINADTKFRGHDIYFGAYYLTADKDVENAAIPVGAPAFTSNPKHYYIELGSKGDLGNNGFWSYDLGGVYTSVEDGKVKNATEREDRDGFILHGAINWDSKEEWAAKVAYTSVDEDSIFNPNYISFNERYVDSFENPLEDIMRDAKYTTNVPVVNNLQDVKVQFEYTPKNSNKHYLRFAYDIVQAKDDKKPSTFLTGVDGDTDKLNVGTFEYRYRIAENTRLRVGYTDYTYGSGNNDHDANIVWTEIFSRF